MDNNSKHEASDESPSFSNSLSTDADSLSSEASSESESELSELSEDSKSSDDDTGPSKWQHWKRWQGPWHKKDMTPILRKGLMINLISCDSEIPISISIEAVALSSTIQNMLNDLEMDTTTPIPITNTSYKITQKIAEYLEYLYDNPKDDDWDINTPQEFTDWELEFGDVDHVTLDNLCLTANYLDIKPLLKLCCKKIAQILEKIPPKEMGIRCAELFGTANDIPENEYNKMLEEHEKYFGDQ